MTADSPNTSAYSFSMNLLQWVLRIFIGAILLGSAVGKALDFGGFIEVLKTYQVFPPSMLLLVAVILELRNDTRSGKQSKRKPMRTKSWYLKRTGRKRMR